MKEARLEENIPKDSTDRSFKGRQSQFTVMVIRVKVALASGWGRRDKQVVEKGRACGGGGGIGSGGHKGAPGGPGNVL